MYYNVRRGHTGEKPFACHDCNKKLIELLLAYAIALLCQSYKMLNPSPIVPYPTLHI